MRMFDVWNLACQTIKTPNICKYQGPFVRGVDSDWSLFQNCMNRCLVFLAVCDQEVHVDAFVWNEKVTVGSGPVRLAGEMNNRMTKNDEAKKDRERKKERKRVDGV